MESENRNLPTEFEAEVAVLQRMGPDDRGELSVAVRENLKSILEAMIRSAMGIWVERKIVNKDGIEVIMPVYQEKPNTDVGQYLINQVIGKPKETSVDLHLKQTMVFQNEIVVRKMDSKDAGS